MVVRAATGGLGAEAGDDANSNVQSGNPGVQLFLILTSRIVWTIPRVAEKVSQMAGKYQT